MPKLFHAVAAFPDSSEPRLSVITFGINYDEEKFVLVAHHHCGDGELPTDSWPDPGTGTAVQWNTARTGQLIDVYWYYGYLYAPGGPDSTLVELIPHPTQGGVFADDAVPAEIDSIAGYGKLGVGMTGYLPCPTGGGQSGPGGDGPGSGPPPSPDDAGAIKAIFR